MCIEVKRKFESLQALGQLKIQDRYVKQENIINIIYIYFIFKHILFERQCYNGRKLCPFKSKTFT